MVAGALGNIRRIATTTLVLLLLSLILNPSLSPKLLGHDYGYGYQSYNYPNINVINRIEHLYALGKTEPDANTDAAVQKALESVLSAIPIKDQKSPFRQFAFRQNMPVAAPQRVAQQEAVQTATVTKTYTGYIQQSVILRSDGVVRFSQESSAETR